MPNISPGAEAKARKFVEAYITSGFKATEAARQTFNIGSKGGKNPQRTAESMGSEYLRKPEVRKILAERLKEEYADKAFVMENLLKMAKNAPSPRDRIRATELIGKCHKMFTDRQEIERASLEEILEKQSKSAEKVDWTRKL